MLFRSEASDSLISDNGLQFDCKAFHEFCSNLGIKTKYSTLAYPQSNGQVKAVNKTILNGLKKRLDGAKGGCAEELPNVVWAYRTTQKRSTGETPFSLTYEAEVVTPAEINLCNAQVDGFAQNNLMMAKRLDLLDECWEAATIQLTEYQRNLAQRYN